MPRIRSKNGHGLSAQQRFDKRMDKLEESGGRRVAPYLTGRAMKLLATVQRRRPKHDLGAVFEDALVALDMVDRTEGVSK